MCPIVSGNWNNSSNAGVWALNCNNVQANANDNYSLRADSMPHAAQAASDFREALSCVWRKPSLNLLDAPFLVAAMLQSNVWGPSFHETHWPFI